MSAIERVIDLVTWPPLKAGDSAPPLSLTADEGTWVKLKDFKDHLNVCLVFFRSTRSDETDGWLKEFQRLRQAFEDLECVVFGVSTQRTDKLREYRSHLGLEYYLLYDPFGVDSRAFRTSSRLRPIIKDGVVLVAKDGSVAHYERGRTEPQRVLEVVAALEGAEVPLHVGASDAGGPTGARDPGAAPDRVREIDADSAESLLTAKDSPYILVDVRNKPEFEADHSPHAVHIPVDELPHRYQDLGQTTHIICVDQAGGAASAAAEFLTSIGCSDICCVVGGMARWTGARVTGGEAEA